MRKSGWTAATGLGSLVLLLAACGGSSSSSNSASGAASNTAPVASSGSGGTSTATAQATATKKASSSPKRTHQSVGPQPSSGPSVSFPPQGTTVMIVQKSNVGYVLSEASGLVVYTYKKDTKGGAPTCTGSCATTW